VHKARFWNNIHQIRYAQSQQLGKPNNIKVKIKVNQNRVTYDQRDWS